MLIIAEGSSDFLAAYSLIHAEGMEQYVAPVAILGAANSIHDEALEYFHGKYVLTFPDYDQAGISAVARWSKQLRYIAADIRTFSFNGLVRDGGEPVKDLRDFLRVDVEQWERDSDVRFPVANFVSNLVKKGSINESK